MSSSIYEVLADLRDSALDSRDQGDKFEQLVLHFLRADPEWVARFSQVWLWRDWPGRDGRPDTGVDIVAQHRDRDGLAAIQCKFYDPEHRVSKKDVDSFLSASGGKEFISRYLFDTADWWGKNAEETAAGQAVPIQRVDLAYLDEARIDWGQFSWATPEVLVPIGPKQLRPHQRRAVDDVRAGLGVHDRGKLVMACGTGKTFTSLKLAEEMVGAGGTVLFLVPSIQLLSQSLREWMQEAEVDIRPFAVCSDVRAGRKTTTKTDDGEISVIDLSEPATTDAATLVSRFGMGKRATPRMSVVFATYQSIDVLAEAQQQGLGDFDLIVCDEAHRTTGVTLAGQDESHFVKVHDEQFLYGGKRLYMTATPKVFGDQAKKKAADADAVLADMDDEQLFGPELHRLGFGDAVEASLLTDYKVLVLAVEEEYVSEHFQQTMAEAGELRLGEAAKLIGCWSGLAKRFGDATARKADPLPMRRAVAFARDIKASKQATGSFPSLVDRAIHTSRAEENSGEDRRTTRVEAAHVDGTMGVQERNRLLAWLKAEPGEETCRILTNARCLSEGVDVPALDAVLFLTPRASQIDIVQAVGRVMRKAPGKELGYVILPVAVPAGVSAHEALDDNERYRVVWQVLQALRSHDERFHAMVNQIELNSQPSDQTAVDNGTPRPEEVGDTEHAAATGQTGNEQLTLPLDLAQFREAVYARIVAKVGERKYWEKWAGDIADIAQAHITRITGLLADGNSVPAREFDRFLGGLRGNLNENISRDEAVEMLAQHLITAPVFEALFAGYDFAAHNPVAQTMQAMLATLDEHNLGTEQQSLDRFYDSVRRRVAGVDNAEGKQRVIVELYENFFATAFKKTVDRLGIVYTPVEIVDFILHSADEVLRSEFGRSLSDQDVHILDGFAGTGTFLTRLLQSGLIAPHDLARKYAEELHGNEILLLAYYIAAVNIETTYAALTGDGRHTADSEPAEPVDDAYEPFPGLVLTDTFQSYEDGDRDDLAVFPANNKRIERQRQLPITVIVGNPPWSVGQDSANDAAANLKYPGIDEAIRDTYAAGTSARSARTLYDSYVRAIKWASLRIGDHGVVAYVTNGGWLDANTADGMRKSLTDEYAAIHVYNLRGNARTSGEQRRKEKDGVFKEGSRATVAIVVLVKNPNQAGPVQVHYTDIGDYLTRDDKLTRIAHTGSLAGLDQIEITPNEDGDWLHQRRDDFGQFLPLGEKGSAMAVFTRYSLGLAAGRDAWVYNSSGTRLEANVSRMVDNYNHQVALLAKDPSHTPERDPTHISWNRNLDREFARARTLTIAGTGFQVATYRPFTKRCVYFERDMNAMIYQLPRMFPTPAHENLGFLVMAPRNEATPAALAVDAIPDLSFFTYTGQFFARWTWEPVEPDGTLAFDQEADDSSEVVDGYRRVDNITNEALARWRAVYGQDWGKDDVFYYCYGLLHSPDYRETYAADLKKMLPRIPLVTTAEDAAGFAEAGRRLAELHVGYELVDPYPLDGLHPEDSPAAGNRSEASYRFYAVTDKTMRFGNPTAEQKVAGEKSDRSTIHYNDRITISGIPEEAYRYQLGSRSAIEWIIDRYHIKTDKPSGIVNDPNDWCRELGDPRYILDLLARIVTVSVETMKIVDNLPPLQVKPEQ